MEHAVEHHVQIVAHDGVLLAAVAQQHPRRGIEDMRAVHGNALEQQRIERRHRHKRKAAQRQIKKAQIDQQRVARKNQNVFGQRLAPAHGFIFHIRLP